MTASDPIKQAWRDSVTGAVLPSLDEARGGAELFYRQIRLRNRVEYGAAALVVLGFTAAAIAIPSPVARAGAILVVLATLFVTWQLNRRASAVLPPDAEAAQPVLVHQRAQFVRQRDALASAGLWYFLPLMPGMLLMMLGRSLADPASPLAPAWGEILSVALLFLVFGGLWQANRLAARRLQAAIDELDLLLGERL